MDIDAGRAKSHPSSKSEVAANKANSNSKSKSSPKSKSKSKPRPSSLNSSSSSSATSTAPSLHHPTSVLSSASDPTTTTTSSRTGRVSAAAPVSNKIRRGRSASGASKDPAATPGAAQASVAFSPSAAFSTSSARAASPSKSGTGLGASFIDDSFEARSESSLSSFDQGSAPATPATAFSTATGPTSSTRSSPAKTQSRAHQHQLRPAALAAQSTPTRSAVPDAEPSSSARKGKGKAKDAQPSVPKSSASPSVPSPKKSTAKGKGKAKAEPIAPSASASPRQSRNSKKRSASATVPDGASAAETSSAKDSNKRRKIQAQSPTQPTSASPRSSYSLRPRRSSGGEPSSATSPQNTAKMTGNDTASPPSAKGKTRSKAKGSKPSPRSSSNTNRGSKAATSEASGKNQLRCIDDVDDDCQGVDLATHAKDEDIEMADHSPEDDSREDTVDDADDGEAWDDVHEEENGRTTKAKGSKQNPLHLNDEIEDDDDDDHDHDGEEEGEGEDEEDQDEDEDEFGEGEDDMDDPYGDGGDDGGAGGMFGLNLRAMAGYMSGLSSRFRSLLASLRDSTDPTVQLVALQDLSELLSVSTEDTLAGYFPTDSFVKELIHIMGGPKPERSDLHGGASSASKSVKEKEEDDEMAAVLAAAAAADMEDSGEKMLLACRCLANLIEAMPYAAHSVVAHGAIPVLNSKLMEITFIDLAEQVLQTLEKISQDYPGSIVKEGGLSAILQYLDFFNIHIQRTAMTAAANCCRKLVPESSSMVQDVMPIIQNVLTYSDQRLVESACKCVVRVVESYRHTPELLEQLLSDQLLAALNNLLLPSSSSSSSSTSLGTSIYTDVLKALGTACRSSPKLAVNLLENNIVETLYHLLTGSPAPADGVNAKEEAEATKPHAMDLETQGAGPTSGAETAAVAVVPDAGGAVAVADMAVLQNLAQRPKEQVQEAVSLVGELLPPLPRDGVFDPRAYTERAYLKRRAAAAKEGRAALQSRSSSSSNISRSASSSEEGKHREAAQAEHVKTAVVVPAASTIANGSKEEGAALASPSRRSNRIKSDKEIARDAAQAKRVEMLRSRTGLVKRFTHLVLPTLVEVYAASVALHVRNKAINGILKIISFVEPGPLNEVLDNVPLASFVAAILSSRDHPTLVNGALQIVELLTLKLPSVYTSLLRREGVMWEIEDIAAQEPSSKPSKTTEEAAKSKSEASVAQPISLPGGNSALVDIGVGSRSGSNPNSTLDTTSTSTAAAATSGLARFLAATSGDNPFSVESLANRNPFGAVGSSAAVAFDARSSAEAKDASIWRARVLRDKFQAETASSEGARNAVQALEHINVLVEKLGRAGKEGKTTEAKEAMEGLASLFSRSDSPISSFELLRSGLADSLYSFATNDDASMPLKQRRALLIEELMKVDDDSRQSAASVLVRRLQESLSRLENVEITTALSGGSDDSRRSPSSLLGRQLRLRLQAEDSSDIPRSCNNIVVTIHAVATFQSLSDYLRPKIASSNASSSGGSGAGATTSSRLSSVLAAFAAATGTGSGAGTGTSTIASGFPELGSVGSSARFTSADSSKKADSKVEESKGQSDGKKAESSKDADTNAKKGAAAGAPEASSSTNVESSSSAAAQASDLGEQHNHDADARALAQSLFGGGGERSGEDRESDEALARQLMDGLLHGEDMDEEGFSDEEFDEEILQSEITADAAGGDSEGRPAADSGDKTINLDVEKDGGKVIAKTPDGTRIATPSNGAGTPRPAESSSTPSPSKPSSYASALQKKPTDWHLEFSIGSEALSLDTTIYGAVHRFETAQSANPTSSAAASHGATGHSNKYIWGNVYTVKYKKVSGPVAKEQVGATPEPTSPASVAIELPASIKEDAPYAKLLQLLAVLHELNAEWRETSRVSGASGLEMGSQTGTALSESAFVNNKLTAKLNRQLEEPMIVASSCLPAWSTDLPRFFPFLFPFEARFAFLQSTSFGYARLITRWQALHSRNQDPGTSSSSRLDDSFGFLGRLQRQKVRISRSNLLASAFKVFELYGSNSSVLEVEYFEEVGTGLGPTLEFYSLVSKEFARKDLHLWRNSSSTDTHAEYVFSPQGLFPAPISDAVPSESDNETGSDSPKKRLQAFKILGQFVAKALLDSRIIDCNFSPMFMRAALNQHVAPTLSALASVDPTLARSLASMQKMKPDEIESLGLDFTVPGYELLELHPGGKDEAVTSDNLDRYISEVLEMTLDRGIRPAVRAFRQGFNLIFPISAMLSFTADELVMLFGNTEEDWSESTLMGSIKPDHGFNAESGTFRDIVSIMASFSLSERRDFLQWLTGSPKLPIGGFSGLHPQLTIVKRPHEAPLKPDDYLPSVMTCVNYLKMPDYSSREKMRERLQTAMKEGSTSFHLS